MVLEYLLSNGASIIEGSNNEDEDIDFVDDDDNSEDSSLQESKCYIFETLRTKGAKGTTWLSTRGASLSTPVDARYDDGEEEREVRHTQKSSANDLLFKLGSFTTYKFPIKRFHIH
ncbi:hypothetical protein HanPSC8_Chr10g0435031 [Helianthus annuus]|nr:hypothetical protein HanPSC8_Chr10g0435031 [Helianthus annuus]